MDVSIFLAKVLGLYIIFISFSLLINAKKLRPLLMDLMDSPPLMYFSGIIALMIGLLIVVSHNMWVADWRILITISGWLALIKGIVLIYIPHRTIEKRKILLKSNTFYYPTMIIYLFLGAYLTYVGFF